MAYIVSNEFRNKEYSGVSEFKGRVVIGNNEVPNDQISRIEIENPIFDSTSDNNNGIFYIGTFISQKVIIKFKNLDGLSIFSGQSVQLYISQYVNETQGWVEIPIGLYLIDDLEENYQETCEISCLDYAVKFKKNVDYSSCFVDDKATIDTILQEICTQCGVTLGSYPSVNGNIEIGQYDSTVSGKQWISYIAELKGCNAKIGRDGTLNLFPLKRTSTVSINALEGQSWKLGEKYEISKVLYSNGLLEFSAGSDTYNTLFIRQDNPFILEQSAIDNIYDEVDGFVCYSLEARNFGDISLDAWDIIDYIVGENTYPTYNSNKLVFEMTIMSDTNVQISSKQQEVTTNYIGGNDKTQIKKLRTSINTLDNTLTIAVEDIDSSLEEYNGRIATIEATSDTITQSVSSIRTLTNEQYEELSGSIDTLQTTTNDEIDAINDKFSEYATADDLNTIQNNVTQITTSTYSKLQIDTMLTDGTVKKLQTTSMTADENGLTFEKTNAKTKTNINESGTSILDENNNPILRAVYDDTIHNTIVETYRHQVNEYFIMGQHSRFENYGDGTGCFYIE